MCVWGGAWRLVQNATSGGLIGSPIVATQPSSSVAVTFDLPIASTLFKINFCSGQLSVAAGGVLNARVTPSYNLTVRASSNGDTTASSTANVTIYVLPVPHAPVFNDTFGNRNVDEHAAINTPILPCFVAYDVDGSTLSFAIDRTITRTALVNMSSSGAVPSCCVVPLRVSLLSSGRVLPVRGSA